MLLDKWRTMPEWDGFCDFMARSNLPYSLEPWQWDDYRLTLEQRETMWIRSRGGDKTEGGSRLAVWQGLMHGQGGWYAASSTQLDRVKQELENNPFVKSVNSRFALLWNGTYILLGLMSGKRNVRGQRNHWVIIDEEGEVNDAKTRNGYDGVLGTLSTSKYHHVLHLGTPKLGSQFDLNRQKPNIQILTHPWSQCPWLVEAGHIQEEMKSMPQWYIDLEYEGKWTVPGGAVFTNIISGPFVVPPMATRRQGVDFNSNFGNALLRIATIGNDTYVEFEKAFQYRLDDVLLQRECNTFPTEVESGGWNTTYAPALQQVMRQNFDGKVEVERLKRLLKGKIYIDPKLTPQLYKQMCSCKWENGKLDCHNWHFVAALLHAIGAGSYNFGFVG